MKKETHILLLFSTFIFLLSCDIVKNPYPTKENVITEGIVFDTTTSLPNTTVRTVLIEEFTGHKCTNCPEGAAEIARIDSIYGDTVIPVSLHAGYFALPDPPGTGMYEEDFTTDLGEAFNNQFGVTAYPAGMVSRIQVSGNYVLTKTQWETAVQQIKNDQPIVAIDITNLYNDSVRTLKTLIDVKWLQNGTSTYKLQVYLIEDHITAWQKNGPLDDPNYDHRHVFREPLNGIWGTDVTNINQGDTLHEEFAININSAYKSKDCFIVALIYDDVTYEVIQAAEAHIMK